MLIGWTKFAAALVASMTLMLVACGGAIPTTTPVPPVAVACTDTHPTNVQPSPTLTSRTNAAMSSSIVLLKGGTDLQFQASTKAELRITSHNLDILNSFPSEAYQNQKLLWQGYGEKLDVTKGSNRQSGDFTELADNNGYYPGECVSAAKALAKSNFPTGDWTKGKRVTDGGVAPGTILATFFANDGTKYPSEGGGHVVILKGFLPDGGIEVWAQNGGFGRVMGSNKIPKSGSGVNNAENYNVVMVPG